MTRYYLEPGWVISQADGDRHYIGVGQLARLYRLRHDQWVTHNPPFSQCRELPHLYPRFDGNYEAINEQLWS